MDELNGMTYLDYVTRETLRLHTPVSSIARAATKDTVVPLSEPFIDRHGVKRHEFRQVNRTAILHYNSSPDMRKKTTRRRHSRCSDFGHS
jgi:hypothetical protein